MGKKIAYSRRIFRISFIYGLVRCDILNATYKTCDCNRYICIARVFLARCFTIHCKHRATVRIKISLFFRISFRLLSASRRISANAIFLVDLLFFQTSAISNIEGKASDFNVQVRKSYVPQNLLRVNYYFLRCERV